MPRKKTAQEPFNDTLHVAASPDDAPTVQVPRRGSYPREVKEFDLKAAHTAWKERNGIDSGDSW